MKTKLQKLEKIYGDRHKVAEALGITERHFRRLLDGSCKPRGALERLVDELIKKHEYFDSLSGSKSVAA